MKIVVDVFGGDNAPDEIVKGVSLALKERPEAGAAAPPAGFGRSEPDVAVGFAIVRFKARAWPACLGHQVTIEP